MKFLIILAYLPLIFASAIPEPEPAPVAVADDPAEDPNTVVHLPPAITPRARWSGGWGNTGPNWKRCYTPSCPTVTTTIYPRRCPIPVDFCRPPKPPICPLILILKPFPCCCKTHIQTKTVIATRCPGCPTPTCNIYRTTFTGCPPTKTPGWPPIPPLNEASDSDSDGPSDAVAAPTPTA